MVAPLEGLRVVDLSTRFSGAFAARLFGDFGAEVLLVETEDGHPLRREPPFLDDIQGEDRSVIHAFANWNKESIRANSNELESLLQTCDVVVTNRVHESSLNEELSPRAIHLSITPHGLDGPLTNVPGNNLTINARVGWASINGYGGEAPLALPRNQNGIAGGVTGFIASVAALRRRNATSSAELVDVSELEAFALTVHPWGVAGAYQNAEARVGKYRTRARGSPGPLWNLSDGQMNFGLADFKNWTKAMDAVNLPEIGSRENLIPDVGRHSQDLRDVVWGLAESLPKLKKWNVFHALTKLRCVVGVVQDMGELLENEQFDARNYISHTEIDGQKVRTAGAPAKLDPFPWGIHKPAPILHSGTFEPRQEMQSSLDSAAHSLTQKDLAEGPLSDVRVLSFGQAWSGTFGTELLALLGADVVQIASLDHPDAFRRIRNHVPTGVVDPDRKQHPRNTQGHYNSVNLHKREITLNLKLDRGKQILWQLIPGFDVVVDNFRPSVLPSWGITLEKLHEVKPGMIWASISGYGESGPYWNYPANGATTEPMSGFSSIHGYAGEVGMNTGGLYPDPISGYFLVATILAALNHRDKTGEPQRVDLSMMEAVTSVIGDHVMEFDATGRVPTPTGNRHELHAPHNIYPTKDEYWVAIAVENDEMWQSLCKLVNDSVLEDPRFLDERERKREEALIDQRVSTWTKERHAALVEETLCRAGVCSARVVPLVDIYREPDPHFRSSGFISEIEHPEAGRTWLPGRPFKFSAARQTSIRPAPCLGQHNLEVFSTELRIDENTYREWVREGITGTLDD